MKISKSEKIRKITGYTFKNQLNDASLWFKQSLSFYEASIVLNEHKGSLSDPLNVFLFNASLSLELLFKAILVAKGVEVPKIHKLRILCNKAEVRLSEDQNFTLDLLTESLLWLSRYPAPQSEFDWNNYHDNILEKHIERSKSGNTYTSKANNKRFPSFENFNKIWEICLDEYKKIATEKKYSP